MTAIPTAGLSGPAEDQAPACLEPPASISLAPTGGRDIALFVLAAVSVVFALKWGQSFFVSLLLGILFAYTLNRLVAWLELIRVPRVAGTSLVMVGVACTFALGTQSLGGQIETILDQVPQAASKLSVGLARLRQGEASTMQKMQAAASGIEKATSEAAGLVAPPKQRLTRVVIDPPGFKLGNFLWANSMGAAALVGQAGMVFCLTFFLLLSGDTYKRKLVRLAGPTLSKRKITVRILDDIQQLDPALHVRCCSVTNLLGRAADLDRISLARS